MSSMDETSNDLKILISKTGAFLKTLRTHESYDPSLILQWKEFEVLCVELDYLMLREVKPKEADINDRFKELETKENELMGNMGVSLIDLSSGEKLSLVLSDRETELEQMAAGVHTVLKTSSNPAKLVLDSVSKGFYGMRKGFGSEIEMSIVKKSCVMLLEELMRLKPEISRVLSKRAGVVAKEWKEMMDGKNENDVIEVLGFMMLLSAYGLVDMFDLIEIRKLLEIVAQHNLASELREVLGLVDKIPESIINEAPVEKAPCISSPPLTCWPELNSLCISMDGKGLVSFLCQHVKDHESMRQAISDSLELACDPEKLVLDVLPGFLHDKFGIGYLLQSVRASCILLLEQMKPVSGLAKEGVIKDALKLAVEWKSEVSQTYSTAMTAYGFWQFIAKYELSSNFDVHDLLEVFFKASKHKQSSNLSLGSCLENQTTKRLFTEVPIEEAPCSASSTPSCWPELKSLCINMDGKGLVSFLCQHVNDHESMREAISDSLELASDPGKLILDVLPGFLFNKFFQTLQFSDVRKSCILLLEQMKPVFCLKKRDMKTKALKLAADWKARLAHTYAQPVLAYGFLLFIVAYNLVSSFDASDLLAFFVKASQRKQSPKLFLALGLADKTTTLINNLLQNTLMLEAVEYICAFELLHEFPPQCILNSYLEYQKNMQKYKGKNLCGPQNKAIDREIVAIRAVIKCISEHNLESHCPLNKFEKQIVKLEKRKTNTICSTQKEEKETKEKQTSTQKEEKKATENQINEVIASQVWTVPAPPQEQQVNFVLHVERIPSEVCTETKVTPVPHSTSSNMLYNIPYEVDSVNAPQEETLVKPAPHGTIASLLESICSKFWTVKSAQQETQVKPAPNTDIPSKLCAQEAPQQEAQEKAAPQSVEIHADLERIPSEACTVNAPQQESQVKLVQHNVSSTLLESIHSIISVEESQQKIEVRTAQPNTSSSPSSWLKWYCVSMDGKGLVLFLCQHVEDHDLMREAVSDSLKSAPNSAKLVLDILPCFLYSNKDFDRFSMHTVRVSCILLLEQLYKLLPQVNISMNVDAMKLAVDWKAKVATDKSFIIIYGLSLFMVTYKLVGTSDVYEVLGVLARASEHKESPGLNLPVGSTDKIPEEKWIKHYSSKHRILLVGDGDFSFSLCLAKAFGSAANMIATSLDSKVEVTTKYSKATANLKELEELGCTILHGVNAVTMTNHNLLWPKPLDRIVFNFPHAGFGLPEINSLQIQFHQKVVKGFLRSAKDLVHEKGEVHVTHKTAHPFSLWKIEKLAEEVGLSLVEKVSFCIEDYPGYHNKRGASNACDDAFPVGEAATFKFSKPSL